MIIPVCATIIGYTATRPFKRNYHYALIGTAASVITLDVLSIRALMSNTVPEFLFWARYNTLFGLANLGAALLSTFVLLYLYPHPTRYQKVGILAPYLYPAGWFAIRTVNPTLLGGPPIYPLAGVPGSLGVGTAGPLQQYLLLFGFWSWYTLLLGISLLPLLVRHYRSQKSTLVKAQLKYVAAAVFLVATIGSVGLAIDRLHVLPIGVSPIVQLVIIGTMFVGMTRHGLYFVAPALETAVGGEAAGPRVLLPALVGGHSYLGLDEHQSMAAFADLVKSGLQGYSITARPPEEVRRRYALETTPMRWLARSERNDAIDPSDLEGLYSSITGFLRRSTNPVVLFEGLDYLVAANGFKPTLAFMDRISKVNERKGGVFLAVSSGISGSGSRKPMLWEVFDEAPLVQARLKAEKTVEVGEPFSLQLDLFNVGRRPVQIDSIEGIVPAGLKVLESPRYKTDGSSLLLDGKRLEPFQLESVVFRLEAPEPGEVAFKPRVLFRDGKAVLSSQEVEPMAIGILRQSEIEFETAQAKSTFSYLVSAFSQDYLGKRYSLDQSGWRGVGDISKGTKIPRSTLYGQGRFGQPIFELLSRGLVEQRTFTQHRGRGGESSKLRVSYERDPVKRRVDRMILGPRSV